MYNKKNLHLIEKLKLKSKNMFYGSVNFSFMTLFIMFLIAGVILTLVINRLLGVNEYLFVRLIVFVIIFMLINYVPRFFLSSINTFDNNIFYQARRGKLKKYNISDLTYTNNRNVITISGPDLPKTIVQDQTIASKLVKKINMLNKDK